jgi:hypothetical protein
MNADDYLPVERPPTKRQLLDRAKTQTPNYIRHVAMVIETSDKLKRMMVTGGVKRAHMDCPRCGVKRALQGALVGKRDHLRMWCDTPGCSMEVME